MAVTPNYGWPVPVATDYVKDGWEAISDLGNAIDTTVAGLGTGLKLITSQTMTGATTTNFTNVFTSTYNYYKLIISFYGSVDSSLINLRARKNTTDHTSGYYSASRSYAFNAGEAANNVNNGSNFTFTAISSSSTPKAMVALDLFPDGVNLSMHGNGVTYAGGGHVRFAGYVTADANVTGFTILQSSGTLTGIATLFGYQK